MSEAATLIDPGTPAPAAALPSVAVAVDPAAAAVPSPTVADPASPGAAASAPDADWRKVLAGDDTDALKALERYATPGDYHRSFTEAQKTIRAKQEGMIKLPGESATDEERAAFQKALGIPAAPDKYERIAPPEGLELADADKSFIDKSIQKLHGMGGFAAHPDVVKTLQSFYHEAMQEQAAVMAAMAVQKKNEGKATLTKLYGQNLDLELKHAQNALVAFGPRDAAKARAMLDRQFADGTTLGDDP